MKNFIKLNEITKDYIFNFLNENNLIGKYIDILYVKPCAVKYYFCKVDQQINSENLTILEGFACEQSNLITKPDILTDDEYSLIPTDCIGIDYNIIDSIDITQNITFITGCLYIIVTALIPAIFEEYSKH